MVVKFVVKHISSFVSSLGVVKPGPYSTLPYEIWCNVIEQGRLLPKDVSSLSLTCKLLQPLAHNKELWTLFFQSYLPSCPQSLEQKSRAGVFHHYLYERVNKLETVLSSLKLPAINLILKRLAKTQSSFQKMHIIYNASDTIFTVICSSMRSSAYLDYISGVRDDRTCVPHFMGYFNNGFPLPSAKTLAPHIGELKHLGPLGAACFYSYFKQNQVSSLHEALSESYANSPADRKHFLINQQLVNIHFGILAFAKNATWSELFCNKNFDPNFATEDPLICVFIKKNLPLETRGLRAFPISILNIYGHSFTGLRKGFIGEDANHELGIDGDINLYGNDQLLEDFKTLCSLPGIDLQAKDPDGKTPLEIAEALGMEDAAEILKTAIAKQQAMESGKTAPHSQ